LLVVCLASAGVFRLAGAGWALLAAAALVLVFWPQGADTMAAVFTRRAAMLGRRAVARVKAAPRRVTAVGGMAAGVVLLPAGASLAAGVGVGLIAAAAGLVGVALLSGWGA
jgi:hypothetical protein